MHKRCVITTLVLALSGALAVGVPSATAAEGTLCVNEFELTISPGLSNSPSTGTFTTNGESGTVTCDGPVRGHRPTGPGRHGEEGRYGIKGHETCSSGGAVEWTFSSVIPTTGGDMRLTGAVSGTYGPLRDGAIIGGTMRGEGTYGKFEAMPLEGDCVTAPITRVRVRCQQWFVNEE